MSEPRESDEIMRAGLLMEAAQTQQRVAQECLQRLQAHLRGLDGVVRDELRHTFSESLSGLAMETEQAAAALRRLRHIADLRIVAWTVLMTLVSGGVVIGMTRWMMPSPSQIEALQDRREALARDIARLRSSGALADLRHCGVRRSLCVRVVRNAPAYGPRGDYRLIAEK